MSRAHLVPKDIPKSQKLILEKMYALAKFESIQTLLIVVAKGP
jgi:hypothetical protein